MQSGFWLNSWVNGRTGFHLPNTNRFLLKYYSLLEIVPNDPIFVPLCGKSVDMHWLAEQGHPVMGVELSPLAAAAFFEEHGISPKVYKKDNFEIWEGHHIKIWVGDFFDLKPSNTAHIKGVYDRAALVALPPPMRKRYGQHMSDLLQPATKSLLISLEYAQMEMSGPPHSVPPDEVDGIFKDQFEIMPLDQRDILKKAPRFQQAGLSYFLQQVYLLERR